MGSYNLEEVIKRWSRDELTTEQVIGQMLLLIQELADRLGNVERRVENWHRRKIPPSDESRAR